jgi:hypothetical protein
MALSGALLAALNRIEKHGQALRCDDGYFRVATKYWSISPKEMAALEAKGCAVVEKVGESTFARFLGRGA